MAVIKWADGKYHGYYARWPEELGHDAWMMHCEIAHAVADQPEGPFSYVNTVLESRNPDGWVPLRGARQPPWDAPAERRS